MNSPLYLRWCEVAKRRSTSEALVDAKSGERLTFGQLAARAEALPPALEPVIADAKGIEFITQTLRAWRDRQALVPIEPGAAIEREVLAALPAEVEHVKHTSGTTGEPRLVLFSGAQIAADVDQIMTTMGLSDQLTNVAVISLAHSYGFSNLVLPLLLHGVPLVVGDSPLPAAVDAALEIVQRAGGKAVLPAVPAMWKAWSGAGILAAERIQIAISAGAPLPIELEIEIFNDSHMKVHNFLGSSECGGIAYDRSGTPRSAAGRVGSALDGVALKVTEGGVLQVESRAVGLGYWPDESPAILGAGRFVTADLAVLDADGGVRLLGRAGETINVAGRKVSPSEVERALAAIPGIEHCVVFGIPTADPQRVEEVVACVNGCVGEAALRSALLQVLPAWMLPRRWWQCEELRPNARGKISRREWRERYLERGE